MNTKDILMNIFNDLYRHFGPQNWWPAEMPLEIVIGAVLTQNTNWKNVERAIDNLKNAGLLDIEKLATVPTSKIAELIKPAGYFNIKAKRLQNLMRLLYERYSGDLEAFFDRPVETLREELLSISGIGPETADDIILYAARKPTFVVDAYTYRILLRHGIIDEDADYNTIKELFEDNLPLDVKLFNEYHALLVAAGKKYCRKKSPLCDDCPLDRYPKVCEYL